MRKYKLAVSFKNYFKMSYLKLGITSGEYFKGDEEMQVRCILQNLF